MTAGTRALALEHLHRNPAEAAKVLERYPPTNVAKALADAPEETLAGVLALMSPMEAGACLEGLPAASRREVLQTCPVATSAALLRVLPEASRANILEGIAASERELIERALRLPPDSAGAAADPRACTLPDDLAVGQAIDRLRETGASVPPTLFVISRDRRLRGAVTLGQLLVAPRDWPVGSLWLASARTVSQRVSVSALASDQRQSGGPVAVLDPSGRLAGVLSEDALRALQERGAPRRATNLIGAICELYWCGMGRLLGEALAIPRVAHDDAGASRV